MDLKQAYYCEGKGNRGAQVRPVHEETKQSADAEYPNKGVES
jgi:hypothetical protein